MIHSTDVLIDAHRKALDERQRLPDHRFVFGESVGDLGTEKPIPRQFADVLADARRTNVSLIHVGHSEARR